MKRNKKKELVELSKNTKRLYQTLCANIMGQDEAIHYFVQGVFKGQFIPESSSKTMHNIFLLSGPPGIGKSLCQGVGLHGKRQQKDGTDNQVCGGKSQWYSAPKEY